MSGGGLSRGEETRDSKDGGLPRYEAISWHNRYMDDRNPLTSVWLLLLLLLREEGEARRGESLPCT